MSECPDCGLGVTRTRTHEDCLTDERVGWMLVPIPPSFFRRVSVQALRPIVAYVGPLPQRDADVLRIHGGVADTVGYVYVICDDSTLEVLYVGKTINPTGRLSSHRHGKPWWPDKGHLILLALSGDHRRDTDAAALYLERLAIRELRPTHNIAGVI